MPEFGPTAVVCQRTIAGRSRSATTRFGPGCIKWHLRCLVGGVVTISEGSGTEQSPETGAEGGARWSASAAAFTAWRGGDREALDELVRLLSPTLWHVVRATGLDRASAEDVVQSTWLTLVDKADTIANPMAVAGWLCTTARRDAWKISKNLRRELATEDDSLGWSLPSMEGPEDGVVLREDHARLRTCLVGRNAGFAGHRQAHQVGR